MDGIKRAKIKPGLRVQIILKKDQVSGKLTEGIGKDCFWQVVFGVAAKDRVNYKM